MLYGCRICIGRAFNRSQLGVGQASDGRRTGIKWALDRHQTGVGRALTYVRRASDGQVIALGWAGERSFSKFRLRTISDALMPILEISLYGRGYI